MGVTDMLSLDIAMLMLIVILERGLLRLMLNLDITDIMVILMDITVIPITDTMRMEPALLATLLAPLTFIPQVLLANKNATSGIPFIVAQMTLAICWSSQAEKNRTTSD